MAVGTGSSIAHRAMDSFMGPRQVEHVHTSAAPEPQATSSYPQQQVSVARLLLLVQRSEC